MQLYARSLFIFNLASPSFVSFIYSYYKIRRVIVLQISPILNIDTYYSVRVRDSIFPVCSCFSGFGTKVRHFVIHIMELIKPRFLGYKGI